MKAVKQLLLTMVLVSVSSTAAWALSGFKGGDFPGKITGDVRTVTNYITNRVEQSPEMGDSETTDTIQHQSFVGGNLNFDLRKDKGDYFTAMRIGLHVNRLDFLKSSTNSGRGDNNTWAVWAQAGTKTFDAKVGYFDALMGFHHGSWMVVPVPFVGAVSVPNHEDVNPEPGIAINYNQQPNPFGWKAQFKLLYGTEQSTTDAPGSQNILGSRSSIQYFQAKKFFLIGYLESRSVIPQNEDLDDEKNEGQLGLRAIAWYGNMNFWVNVMRGVLRQDTYTGEEKTEISGRPSTIGGAATYQFTDDIHYYARIGAYVSTDEVETETSAGETTVEKTTNQFYVGYSFPLDWDPDVYLRFAYYSAKSENVEKVEGTKTHTTEGDLNKFNMRFDYTW